MVGFRLKARGNKVVNVPIPAVCINIQVLGAQALSIEREIYRYKRAG